MTGGFPVRGSPAARVEGCVSFTGSRRTTGWSWGAEMGSEAAVDRPFPGEGVAGGEGKQEWGLKESKAHLWVLGIEARVVGDGVSTASGGLRARSTAAG